MQNIGYIIVFNCFCSFWSGVHCQWTHKDSEHSSTGY